MAETNVELTEVTKDNVDKVLALRVKPEQSRYVADNARSLAEAYVYPDRARPWAVCVGDEPVGFLMLDQVGPDHPEAPEGRASYFLWRLMIAAEHQGRGYGRGAVLALIDRVKKLPDSRGLSTSFVPGDGSPGPFYERLGFKPTGEEEGGEIVVRLNW